MNKTELTLEKRSLIFLLMALLAMFLWLMQPFWTPVVLATIIVVLFHPVYSFLNRKFKNKPRAASLVTTLWVVVILILPSALVSTILINQTYGIINDLDFRATFSQLFSNDIYVHYVEPYISSFENRFHIQIDLLSILTQAAKEAAPYIYKFSPQVLIGTANFIFDFLIMIVGIYFLFVDGPRVLKIVFDISPLRDAHELRLADEFKNVIQASVFGYLVTSLVQGLLAAFGFAISGLPTFAVLGTLTFFMSMVPIVGASGVWIPVCVWLFLKGEIGWGIFNLIWGALLISGIDNILKPLIIQGRTHIHPLLIFFSIFGGIALFGPLGILFGPVITALFIATVKIYREELI